MSQRGPERSNIWGERVVDVYSDSGTKTGEIVKTQGFFGGEKTSFKATPSYSSSSTYEPSSKLEELLVNELTLPVALIAMLIGAFNGWQSVPDDMLNIMKLIGAVVGGIIGTVGGVVVAAVIPWALVAGVAYLAICLLYYIVTWLFQ